MAHDSSSEHRAYQRITDIGDEHAEAKALEIARQLDGLRVSQAAAVLNRAHELLLAGSAAGTALIPGEERVSRAFSGE